MNTVTERKKIGDEAIELCYDLAKKVYQNQLEQKKAVEILTNKGNMNGTSANGYIYVFTQMMEGEEYKRTINQKATKLYLDGIKNDFGDKQLSLALLSVRKHIDYYSKQGKGRLKSIAMLITQYD